MQGKDLTALIELIHTKNEGESVEKVLAFKGNASFNRLDLIQKLITYAQTHNDLKITKVALLAFERIKIKSPDNQLYYNVANGYQILYELTANKDIGEGFECIDVFKKAVKYFQKSINFIPSVSTNLGNLYDFTGRPVEAIDFYDRALKMDSNFGMALGNKAYTLELLSHVSGYPTVYLIYAYQLYRSAIKNKKSVVDNGGQSGLDIFNEHSKKIFEYFEKLGKSDQLKQKIKHPRYKKITFSKFMKFYIDFCFTNNLFLNMHLSNKPTDASIGDSIFPKLLTSIDQDERKYVEDIAFRFNEISESFMTARLTLIESQYKNSDFSQISEQTTLVNNLDYSVSNIYIGYLKTAYKEAFSVLDKVAIMINHYLDLGHSEDSVYYGNVWFEKQDNEKDPKILLQKVKKERLLLGIYLICQELYGSKYSVLRNAFTHRYVRVYKHINGPKGTFTFDELTKLTVEVFYKVKCVITYLSLFITDKEQAKKIKAGKVITMTLPIGQNLDLWE